MCVWIWFWFCTIQISKWCWINPFSLAHTTKTLITQTHWVTLRASSFVIFLTRKNFCFIVRYKDFFFLFYIFTSWNQWWFMRKKGLFFFYYFYYLIFYYWNNHYYYYDTAWVIMIIIVMSIVHTEQYVYESSFSL